MKIEKGFSIQTWSVRDYLQKDYIKNLEKLKDMGYSGVEFARYGGLDAKTLKKEIDRIGLRPIASHISRDDIAGEKMKQQLEYDAELGTSAILFGGVSFKNYDEVKETAELLNKFGEEGRKYNILVGLHNHGFEYIDTDGTYSVDYLMKLTNPETVILEEDIFWTEHAGINHLDFLEKHKDRIRLIHLKQKGANGNNAEFPDGIFDIKKVIEKSLSYGIDEFIVEQEEYPSGDSMVSAKIDIDYLNKL